MTKLTTQRRKLLALLSRADLETLCAAPKPWLMDRPTLEAWCLEHWQQVSPNVEAAIAMLMRQVR